MGALAGSLYRDGFSVFLDQWEVVGGDQVTGRLEDGIRRSMNGVLVVGPHALSRPWVREEYEALLRKAATHPSRRLIPVLYGETELPAFMANRAWVDLRQAAPASVYDAALDQLERQLRGEDVSQHTPSEDATRTPTHPDEGAGPLRRSLVVRSGRVILRAGTTEFARDRASVGPTTLTAAGKLLRLWHRDPVSADPSLENRRFEEALADVGRRLSTDLLAGEVGAALAAAVAKAIDRDEILELGVEAPTLGTLPLETLQLPSGDGEVAERGAVPLVLHGNVAMYRDVARPAAAKAYKVRGPLRILVAIASPESQLESGELLNYEAELARILASVEPARRRGEAHVRVLAQGSLTAISRALANEPEGFHVLHLSCHARPGELLLETAEGGEDRVSARRFLDEGVPAGVGLPMIVLSGCSTGIGTGRDSAGEQAFGGVAQQLLDAGLPAVLAMQAPVSEPYATELVGELYAFLATADVPDPLAALSAARRTVERRRQQIVEGGLQRMHAEWATPALWLSGLRLPLFSRRESFGPVTGIGKPVLADGIVVRQDGEFIGRRRELRLAQLSLEGERAGVVIHGIGGVGKSTFAAELISRQQEDVLVISLHGRLSVDALFDVVGARLSLLLPNGDEARGVADVLRRADIEWADRWRALSELLSAVPMIVLLDDFEDNLLGDDATWAIRDPELAELLSRWARRPGLSKLLVTSRYPFELLDGAHDSLRFLHLGPLSAAETAKLVWQLPGLDSLSDEDRKRAYRDVGGHPRTLESLDALLRGGQARFSDVAERLERRLSQRGITDPTAWMATRERDVDTTLAEAVTLAVDDVVLADVLEGLALTPLARELVIGTSVYRVPVEQTALVWQVADETEPSPEAELQARIARLNSAFEAARSRVDSVDRVSLTDLGLTDAEVATYEMDLQVLQRPPVDTPREFEQALAAALAEGFVAPVTRSDETTRYTVHRWTARAIEGLQPEMIVEAHRRGARYWRWRVARIAQSRRDDIEQLIEARYHHRSAHELEAALGVTDFVLEQLQTWGEYGRAAELCRETLDWVDQDSAAAARYIQRLGILAYARGDYDEAEQRYTQSLRVAQRLGDEPGVATTNYQLGVLSQARGDYDTAERQYTQALEITNRLGDDQGLARTYHQLGVVAQDRGDLDAAEQRYTQALEITERLGDEAGRATSYHQLGVLAHARGDYDGAEQRYVQSVEISERLGDQAALAVSYRQLGALAGARGDDISAQHRYAQALEIAERLGDQASIGRTQQQLGVLAQARGELADAEQRYEQALAIAERIGDQPSLARIYHQLGLLATQRGDSDAARQRIVQSLAIGERLGDPKITADGYYQLGALAQQVGDQDAAEQHYSRAREIFERLGDPQAIASTYRQLGTIAQARGDHPQAEALYEAVISRYSKRP